MKELIELYHISSPSRSEDAMHEHLIQKLCDLGMTVNVDNTNNIYAQYGKADSYPCIVAHTDEVHKEKPEDFEVLRYKGNLFGFSESEKDFVGLGADDKNGIWIALQVAKAFTKAKRAFKVAFFPGEEIGCVGSGKAEMDFFKDCRFVIQFDRKNGTDFITSVGNMDLCSKEFIKAVSPLLKQHGYKETTGLTTDVYELKCRELDISVANLSCGYYNPHTNREMTNIKELKNALALAKEIMMLKESFPHEAEIPKIPLGSWTYKPNYGYKYDYTGSYKGNWDLGLRSRDDWDIDLTDKDKTEREVSYYGGYR